MKFSVDDVTLINDKFIGHFYDFHASHKIFFPRAPRAPPYQHDDLIMWCEWKSRALPFLSF